MYQIIALIKLEWGLTKFWKGLEKKVLFPAISLLFSNIQFHKSVYIKYTEELYLKKPNKLAYIKKEKQFLKAWKLFGLLF